MDDPVAELVFPIAVELSGNKVVGGTAFIATLDDNDYLVTVAHALTGNQNFTDRWEEWASQIHLQLGMPSAVSSEAVDKAVPIRTFREVDSLVRPRFRYTHTIHSTSQFVDLLMLPVRKNWAWAMDVPRVQISAYSQLSVGNRVSVSGFPTSERPLCAHRNGPVLSIPGETSGLITARMTAGPGYSGSPVFSDHGAFVGMCAGQDSQDESIAQIIPIGPFMASRFTPGGFFHALTVDQWWGADPDSEATALPT